MPRLATIHGKTGSEAAIDASRKYVRVTEVRQDGFVAFDFAIGEPEIYVEMLLPYQDFVLFCEDNKTIDLTGTGETAPSCDLDWRLRDAIHAAAAASALKSSSPAHSSSLRKP